MSVDGLIKAAYIAYFAILLAAAGLVASGRTQAGAFVALGVVVAHWLLSGIALVTGDSTAADRYNFNCPARALTAVGTDTLFTAATVVLFLAILRGPSSLAVGLGIGLAFVANIGCVQIRFNTPHRCNS